MAFPYAVAKRRKRGRLGVAQLRRIIDVIARLHCQCTPAANPMGYVPAWDHEDNLQAFRLVVDLRRKVEYNEVYATDADTVRLPY